MKNSNAKFYVGMSAALVVMAAFVWFCIYMIMDVEHQKDIEQKKQDACISAGGAWIHNQNTKAYCFFNK